MGELGQVFTPTNVAQLMSEMLLNGVKKPLCGRVLDPCIGQNVFLNCVGSIDKELILEGVEIDTSLISKDIKAFFGDEKHQLHLDNFFNFSKKGVENFDYVITNPPYVRQEKMTQENDKKTIRSLFADKKYKIPAKSNLYIYFLLKSIDLLKNNGKMVAIIYDSWLYSSYGESFKEILSSLGSIESVVHFQNEAFTNADVGATVIEFIKGKAQTTKIRYVAYDNAKTVRRLKDVKWEYRKVTDLVENRTIATPSSKIVPLSEIAEINRGTSALSNRLFVFKDKTFDEAIPFLKSVKDIQGMTATKDKHLLAVHNSFAKETSSYLEKVKGLILANNGEFYSLAKKIENGELWYSPRLAKPGDIIFNYYLRDSFDFILNSKRLQSSDNFYNLRFKKDVLAHFALLNSSYVKKSVIHNSRRQGSGLRKIQLYEFKNVLVPNLYDLTQANKAALENLGRKLSKQKRNSMAKVRTIAEIDKIIHKELDIEEETVEIVYSNTEYGTALV